MSRVNSWGSSQEINTAGNTTNHLLEKLTQSTSGTFLFRFLCRFPLCILHFTLKFQIAKDKYLHKRRWYQKRHKQAKIRRHITLEIRDFRFLVLSGV